VDVRPATGWSWRSRFELFCGRPALIRLAPAARFEALPGRPVSGLLAADHDVAIAHRMPTAKMALPKTKTCGEDADAGGRINPHRERHRGSLVDEVRGHEVVDGQGECHQCAGQDSRPDQRQGDLAEVTQALAPRSKSGLLHGTVDPDRRARTVTVTYAM